MIKKNSLTVASQQLGVTKKKLPLSSSNSKKSIISQQGDGIVFDAGRILENYHNIRQEQHKTLANANLSQELKRLLFGFSQSYYLPPLDNNLNELVIENHPIRGRVIMPHEKYETYIRQKQREDMLKPSQKVSSVGGVAGEREGPRDINDLQSLTPLGQVSETSFMGPQSQKL